MEKYQALLNWFKDKDGVLVAFSGGVDSTLVAYAAKQILGDKALAVTANSPLLPPGELEEAKKIANFIGIRHLVIDVNELENEHLARNPPNRCYYCKLELMAKLLEIARHHNLSVVVDGTNADDMKSYRPGIRALKELGIRSPLAEVGLTKADVRAISRMLKLPTADKPPMTCLASRFPYGVRITPEAVRRVGEAELIIKKIAGVKLVRVRDHGIIARIEVGRDEREKLFDERILDEISKKLKELGYLYVAMELEGYVSGSLDKLVLSSERST
ncbi:MAG: ATP-dependent sacrificial sulfur transferase LarE [archaeon GB-1867-005]|nr:ATP-dependent sacrificial sulfur transferase LarE [Candidatus Culexmicrobium cathedralense]